MRSIHFQKILVSVPISSLALLTVLLFQNCGQSFNSKSLDHREEQSDLPGNSNSNAAATSADLGLLKNAIESVESGTPYPSLQIGQEQSASFNLENPGRYMILVHTPDKSDCQDQAQSGHFRSQGGCWTSLVESETPAASNKNANDATANRVKTFELSKGPQMLPTLGVRSGSTVFLVPVDETPKASTRAPANVSGGADVGGNVGGSAGGSVGEGTTDITKEVTSSDSAPKEQNISKPQANSQDSSNTTSNSSSKAALVPPANPSCGSLRSIPSSSSKCEGSPTLNMIKSFQCVANNYAKPTNAKPCSQRYSVAWKMDLRSSDKGRYAVDVLKERHGSILPKNTMYCSACPGSQNLNKAMTVDVAPGGAMALQRNIEPGIVPSSSFNFANFPNGTDRICISMEVFIPKDFVGNDAGYKLGYGIWGGDTATGGGTSPVVQVKKTGFVVRNTWNGSSTSLYSYHLNRGGSGRWANQNDKKCDSNTCCIYGDSSQSGKVTKGRWVQIEEEVVLNTMDKHDGYARLWIDGQQVGEITNMLINEKTAKMKIKGLLINDMWGGNIGSPKNQAKRKENYWLKGYTVYH